MIDDVLTVLWKEWKEVLAQYGRGKLGKAGLALSFLPGLLIPLQFGRAWVETPAALTTLLIAPLTAFVIVADTIAGERERHTLETLLASRLPDRAILYGKLGAAVVFELLIVLGFIIPPLVLINLIFGRGELLVYPLVVWLGVVLLAPLLSVLLSAIGLLVSMRAPSVRQAQLTLTVLIFVLFVAGPLLLVLLVVGIVFVFSLGAITFPSEARALAEGALDLGWPLALLAAMALLLAADAVVLRIAERRFTRTRLVLD
jgi:ABC-2 type transport system permease protein